MLGKRTAPIQGFVVLKALEVASTDLLGAISYLPNLLRGASGLRVRGVVVLWGGRGYSPGDLPGCAGLLRLLLLRLILLRLILTGIRILDVRTGTGVMPLLVLRVVGILAVFVVLVARGIVHQHRVVAVLWVLIILVVMLVLLVVVLRVVGILAVGRGNIAQPYTGIFNPILLLLLLLFDGTTTRNMVSRIVVGILAVGRRNIAQPYARIF